MSKFKPLACGFHSHLDTSLDGGSTAEGKILRAAKLGRPADCVTDHGVMSGLIPHYNASQKLLKSGKIENPVLSIHGIEAYIIDPHRPPKKLKNGKEVPRYYHLTIHFKTKKAYEYFCKMTPVMESRAIVIFGERKPLMTFEELEPIAGHITIGSGCLIGPVMKNALVGNFDLAKRMYEKLRSIAGPGNFFAEVFPHIIDHDWKKPEVDKASKKIIKSGEFIPIKEIRDWEGSDADYPDPDPCTGGIDIQKKPNEFILSLAEKYNDPVIISLDDHYAEDEDRLVQEVRLGNGQEKWKFYGSYASHSSEVCAEVLKKQLNVTDKQIEGWIDNSYQFVDNFGDYTVETADDRWLLPTVEMVYNEKKGTREKFWELAKKHDKLPKESNEDYKIYVDRIEYELSVLCDNPVADFLPYFFVLEDICEWAKRTGNSWNTRGSAGGSLVLFAIGVSITDPIKYNLPFERFLTLGRIASGSLPDIDVDCEDRLTFFRALKDKYGDRVALISTNLLLKLKSSILDAERSILGYVRSETTDMTKAIKGADQGQSDKEWLFGKEDKDGNHIPGFWDDEQNPIAQELRSYSENNPHIWDAVMRCIGITKTKGVHAGGLIISPEPVYDYMPIMHTKVDKTTSESDLVTAYDMKGVEGVGGVKFDFLGLNTLKALSIGIQSIKEVEGVDLEWKEWEYDESVIKDVIEGGKLATIFQINTDTVRPFVNMIKPKNVVEIAALTSLVRPGALAAPSPDPNDDVTETAASYYIKCARQERNIYYIHDDLEPILNDTNGIILFQEQTLQIYRDLAGYSFEEAEAVRRGIGKKIPEVLEKHGNVLKERLMKRGWREDQAVRLFDSIQASGRYSFNKSHAVSYAIVAYNCCWMKKRYPAHYWKGMLTINVNRHDKLVKILDEAREYLLDVDVQKSDHVKWLIEDGKIRPPLNLIKGCGEKTVEKLKEFIENPLKDIAV